VGAGELHETTVSDLVYIGAPEANSEERVIITPLLGGMSNVYLEQAHPIVKHNVERFLSGRFDEMINRVPHEPALS
jgi:hypothetical protein